MLSELRVRLELHNDKQNHHRYYEVELRNRMDLFTGPCVWIHYGRVGTRGSTRRFPFDTVDDALDEVTSRLQRRATAERRLGASYRLVNITISEDLAFLAGRAFASFGIPPGVKKSHDQEAAGDATSDIQ